ncbi:hypothetical protein NKI56_17030 [Mesorhizobium sp. M0622]|uniref:hypothetical protein n=1 Tax=unclassified Mesorhizobium TaxID=325217 RepID=UPI00333DA18E
MDSLTIQDVFEPYYAGRKRFAPPSDKSLPAEAADGRAKKPLACQPLAERKPATETDNTTEH